MSAVSPEGAAVHVYAPRAFYRGCAVIDCTTCARQRRAFVRSYEWFGGDITCTGCGQSWGEEGRAERPLRPGWRRERREWARAQLAELGVVA